MNQIESMNWKNLVNILTKNGMEVAYVSKEYLHQALTTMDTNTV